MELSHSVDLLQKNNEKFRSVVMSIEKPDKQQSSNVANEFNETRLKQLKELLSKYEDIAKSLPVSHASSVSDNEFTNILNEIDDDIKTQNNITSKNESQKQMLDNSSGESKTNQFEKLPKATQLFITQGVERCIEFF